MPITHLTYSFDDERADVYACNFSVQDGSYRFDVKGNGWTLTDVVLHMGGLHNIENSIVALTIAKHLGIDDEKIKSALANFKGVHRRFEYIVRNEEHILIDDYAHHPEELKALISGVKSLFPDEKLTLIFQPHLYSRTKDLYKEFGAVLSMADELILLPIYPARELPMPGVTSELIFHEINNTFQKDFIKRDHAANDKTGAAETGGDVRRRRHRCAGITRKRKIGEYVTCMMKQRIILSLWWLLAIAVTGMLVAAVQHKKELLCTDIKVEIEGNEGHVFVDERRNYKPLNSKRRCKEGTRMNATSI